MVVGSAARFSALETGLANAKRPKVKNAKKKEATRANNIVLEKAGVAEEFEERELGSTNRGCLSMSILQIRCPLLCLSRVRTGLLITPHVDTLQPSSPHNSME